jgi:predicted transcriptional regulator
VKRGYHEVDASKCHDPKRAQALSDAQAAPNAVHEVLFSRASLLALMVLSCTAQGRAMRTSLMGSTRGLWRIDAEAMRALEDAGLAETKGQMVHITEDGDELARKLVMVARDGGKEGAR